MKSPRGKRLAHALCVLAASAAPVAIGACGSDDDDGSNPPDSGGSQPTGHVMTESTPAHIDQKPHAFVSSALLRPVVNAWRTSSRKRFTEVNAGALARDNSTGVFAIFRQEFLTAKQDLTFVKVNDSGPLRITRAPLGRKVEKSAQRNGKIRFAGASGVRGTLHLSDDKVRLREP